VTGFGVIYLNLENRRNASKIDENQRKNIKLPKTVGLLAPIVLRCTTLFFSVMDQNVFETTKKS